MVSRARLAIIPMKKRKILMYSIAISLAIWCIWTWPLPRYATQGIPIAHSGGEQAPVQFMVPGDHLQLLYYFWLFSDMLSGDTPWMHNPYEFHTGDDGARHEPSPYYAPFSWVFALFAPFSTRAFSYNMAGFISIWITYLLSWLLVRRYIRSEWIAAAAACLAIMLPYRWFTLLGGSPTGFGMAITPLLLWGLDRAVRNDSLAGGIWAGLALVFSYTSDLHVFFFNVLLTPAWCLVAFVARDGFSWRSRYAYSRLARALLPAALALIALVLYSRAIATELADTHMAEGRSIREVMTFSPQRSGFWGMEPDPVSDQIHIGYVLPALLFAGALLIGLRLLRTRPRPWRDAILYGMLLTGFTGIALLALGPHGPRGAFVYLLARDWIPQYDMIRQTGKIFAILPPLLAVLVALSLASLPVSSRPRIWGHLVVLLPILVVGAEYANRVDPPVCLLANEQPAYLAVAEDAEARGRTPHIFVVPLWPGDSHYASAYQHYASLYRLRMINGYTPAVDRDYYEHIFLTFQNVNQGWLTEDQADALLSRGITHIIVHEDLFPEKVSPFPIGFTLDAMVRHPRLTLLKQAGAVWTFRLEALPGMDERMALFNEDAPFFPARHWIFERLPHKGGEIRADEGASRGHYLALTAPGATTRVGPTPSPPAHDLRWMFRIRGQGELAIESRAGDDVVHRRTVALDEDNWVWLEAPVPVEAYEAVSLELLLDAGSVDLCSALLIAGRQIQPAPGNTTDFPAALFFHAGHVDPETSGVLLRKDIDPSGPVFYGPKTPLEAGYYIAELHFTADTAPGTKIGALHVDQLFTSLDATSSQAKAGDRLRVRFALENNLPVNLVFEYYGHADVYIDRVTLKRLKDPPS